MSVLKKNIKLHPFTAPSADNITPAAESEPRTAGPKSNGAGGKEGGETLKLPDVKIIIAFGRLMEILEKCYAVADTLPFENEDNPFEMDTDIFYGEYEQLSSLIKVYNFLGEDEGAAMYDAVRIAISEKAYAMAAAIAQKYQGLKPFWDAYTR